MSSKQFCFLFGAWSIWDARGEVHGRNGSYWSNLIRMDGFCCLNLEDPVEICRFCNHRTTLRRHDVQTESIHANGFVGVPCRGHIGNVITITMSNQWTKWTNPSKMECLLTYVYISIYLYLYIYIHIYMFRVFDTSDLYKNKFSYT